MAAELTSAMDAGRSARTPDTRDADAESAIKRYGFDQTASSACNTAKTKHSEAKQASNSWATKQGSRSRRDGRKAPDAETKESDVRPKLKHQSKEPVDVKPTETASMLPGRYTTHKTDEIKLIAFRPNVKNEKRGTTSFSTSKEIVAFEDKRHNKFDNDRRDNLWRRDGRKAPDAETKEPDVRPKLKHQGKEPIDVKSIGTASMLQGRHTAHTIDGIKPIAVGPKVKNKKWGTTSFSKPAEIVAFEDKSHDTFDSETRGGLCQSDSVKRRCRKTEIKTSETGDLPYGADALNHGFSTVVSFHEVLIITMNANGKGTADKRREGITYTVMTNKPMLVLFQEFKWIGISSKIWEKHPLPFYYQYFGNTDASLLYDTRHIVAEQLSSTEMRRILEKLQQSSNNNLKKPFPMDFDPLARMCISSVTTIGVTVSKFICVSWHGPYRRSTVDFRKDYFSYLLEFLRNIVLKFQSPLLIAGDFNIDFQAIEALIKYPFKACSYRPSARREGAVIDYFITTENLELSNIRFLDIGDHESSFDHDPLISSLNVLNMREQAKLF